MPPKRRPKPKRRVPRPPPKPAFPPDQITKKVERAYVAKHRVPRMRAARAMTGLAAQAHVSNELKVFARNNVLSKSYPTKNHVIICEGDSWFNHPFISDIPEQLGDFGYSILHSNCPGKLLAESLADAYFLRPLKDARRPQIKALLLSGGGNDLITWNKGAASFSPIFRKAGPGHPAADYLDAANIKLALGEMIGCLEGIAKKLSQANAAHLPVLLHCYDQIAPKKYGPSPLKGMWINPQLDAIGAPSNAQFRKQITAELQKAWMAEYKGLCDRLGWHFVKTQDIVADHWYDEIHPNNHAFYQICTVYWEVLHRLGILPS